MDEAVVGRKTDIRPDPQLQAMNPQLMWRDLDLHHMAMDDATVVGVRWVAGWRRGLLNSTGSGMFRRG
jgi:hypothetical protein